MKNEINERKSLFFMRFGEEIQTGDQLALERIKNILNDCLIIDPKNRPDFLKLFSNHNIEREKLKYYAFIQENSVQDLNSFFKKDKNLKSDRINAIDIDKGKLEIKINEVIEENEILKKAIRNYENKWEDQIT